MFKELGEVFLLAAISAVHLVEEFGNLLLGEICHRRRRVRGFYTQCLHQDPTAAQLLFDFLDVHLGVQLLEQAAARRGSRIHQMEKAGFSQCLGHGAQVPVEDQDIHFYHSVRKEHGEGLG